MEASAQQSAQDAVQNYGYSATFPILLSIDGNPTYFMSLYGDSNTVKGYAFVSLEDKTVVGTGLLDVAKSDAKALNSALENYIDALEEKGVADNVDKDDVLVDDDEIASSDNLTDTTTEPTTETESNLLTVTGEVTDIKSSVNDGNTVYYLQIDGKYYYIKVTDDMEVLLINTGDTVTVEYENSNDTFISAKSVTR
jgi:hypothetical protein